MYSSVLQCTPLSTIPHHSSSSNICFNMLISSLISTRSAPIDNTRHHSSTLRTLHHHSSSSKTFPNMLSSSLISTRFPFLILIGFGNMLPVGTRVQTCWIKDAQNVSFLDLQNGSKIDRFWSDFGSSKRYLKWTPKRNHFRVHFWVHFLVRLRPNGSVWRREMVPSENNGPKKWTQKWTPKRLQNWPFWEPF